jgi:hypothetical protein
MKKTILLLFFLVGVNCSLSSKILATPSDSSFIASIKSPDAESLNFLKAYFKSLPGVTSSAYCDNHNIFLITVDNSTMTPGLFVDAFKKAFSYFTIEIKSGTVKEIKSYCTFNDPIDSQTVKQN